MRLFILSLSLSVFLGCAGVKFYSREELNKSNETGIRFYYPKPYLLVARTGNKDKPVEISIVYLPDLSKPHYAKHKKGWGVHTFSLTLTNGILTAYGQTSDTKIPETITSLGSLLSAGAAVDKAETPFDMYEIKMDGEKTYFKRLIHRKFLM